MAAAARTPAIYGMEGLALSGEETDFFRAARPAGYILFARNCGDPAQLRSLTDSLKAIHPDYPPLILIDQEGGRVARLKPPHWRLVPPAGLFAGIARQDRAAARRMVYLNARLIAADLTAMGINTDCAPLADIPSETCHDVIGDRAYGTTAHEVIQLAEAMAEGLSDGGILPVLKHIPGHGRATVDSHEDLPVVDAALDDLIDTDFEPFTALADVALGMTAHIRYSDIDPEQPATLSPTVIGMIRETIGFTGILMTDDLSMKALKGDLGDLARRSLAAGCDLVLHCNGDMAEMRIIAAAMPSAKGKLTAALDRLVQEAATRAGGDAAALLAEYYALAGEHALAMA